MINDAVVELTKDEVTLLIGERRLAINKLLDMMGDERVFDFATLINATTAVARVKVNGRNRVTEVENFIIS